MKTFFLIFALGLIGNFFGGWNIRTLAQGRYLATAILTITAGTLNMTASRTVAREATGLFAFAWALGSCAGILSSIWIDKRLKRE